MAFICNNEIRRCVLGFNPVDDIIATIRIQSKPINITVVQIYAPTSSEEEEDSDAFYDKVQSVLDQIPNGDILYIIGDWNAKVGKELSIDITGNFGLGKRNERGDQLVELCSRNDLRIMNTFFKKYILYIIYTHEGYTHGYHLTTLPEIKLITYYANRDGKVA